MRGTGLFRCHLSCQSVKNVDVIQKETTEYRGGESGGGLVPEGGASVGSQIMVEAMEKTAVQRGVGAHKYRRRI